MWDIAVPTEQRLRGLQMAGFRARDTAPIELQVVPFPAVTLVIDLGSGPVLVDDARGSRQTGSIAVGIAPDGLRARGRRIECLQVRLSPALAHDVLHGAAADASGALVVFDDIWGRGAGRLEQQLREASGWAARFAIVEAALATRAADARRTLDPEVEGAWSSMVHRDGQLRVEELAAELGWSRKRLWSRFRSQIGLTPKRAAQLVRFDHAAHLLAAGQRPAQVAASTGYVDQSHLHRDMSSFAGLTPSGVADAAWLAVDDVAWASG